MRIIYEQGDVVYNKNNYTYGIVIRDNDESAKVLEVDLHEVFINDPPKAALKYCGQIDIVKVLQNELRHFAE
jgi:hypothetical protein